MNTSTLSRWAKTAGASLGVAALTQAGAWAASRRAGRMNVADVAWGPGLAGIAAASAATAEHRWPRPVLAAAGVSAWAARLAIHVARASAGRGEDPRYEQMLQDAGQWQRVRKVFLTQGLAQWLISLPIQAAATDRRQVRGRGGRGVVIAGTILMVAGGLIEAVADAQKAAWKAGPDHGPVMDRGLWAWSRHPNYFGDTCFWWGAYLVCAASRTPAWTIVSPAAMNWLLVAGTGARRSERLRENDPDYVAYQQRVSFFLPWPPARAQ